MEERAAKPFWDSLEAIERTEMLPDSHSLCRTRPLLAILENVYGVLGVMDKA